MTKLSNVKDLQSFIGKLRHYTNQSKCQLEKKPTVFIQMHRNAGNSIFIRCLNRKKKFHRGYFGMKCSVNTGATNDSIL